MTQYNQHVNQPIKVQLTFTVDEARELYAALANLYEVSGMEVDLSLKTLIFNQLHEAGIL